MNNKVILGIIAVVAIVVIIFALMNKGGDDQGATNETDNNTAQQQSTTPPPPPASASNPTSLKDLVSRSGAMSCTYSDAGNTGTVYAANGKARVDVSQTVSGKTTVMHSIIDGSTYYSWMDGQTTGVMMTVNLTGTGAGTNAEAQAEVNKSMNYSCSNWSQDSSKFTPPTSVNFTDLGGMGLPGQ